MRKWNSRTTRGLGEALTFVFIIILASSVCICIGMIGLSLIDFFQELIKR